MRVTEEGVALLIMVGLGGWVGFGRGIEVRRVVIGGQE